MSKKVPQKCFQKIVKSYDDFIFPVSFLVSNFASLGLESKVETGLGLGLGRVGLDYSPAN